MISKVTFELVEEQPNIVVARANGRKISGASICRRKTGEHVSLFVHRTGGDGAWYGAVTMDEDDTHRTGVKVADLLVQGPRICPTCDREWPR